MVMIEAVIMVMIEAVLLVMMMYLLSWGKWRAKRVPKDSWGDNATNSLGYNTHQHSSLGTESTEEDEEEEEEVEEVEEEGDEEENRTTMPACWLIS